jgi:hypothetical protein
MYEQATCEKYLKIIKKGEPGRNIAPGSFDWKL